MTLQTFPANTHLPDDRWPGVFVFGSNLQGTHGAGAARTARDQLSYRTGLHDELGGHTTGRHGQGLAYGLSTKAHWSLRGDLEVLRNNLPHLHWWISNHDPVINRTWNITMLGTGLAGLDPADVAPILAPLAAWPTVRWDERWLPYLQP